MSAVIIALMRCPHGLSALAVRDAADTTGTRITRRKCCGRWDITKKWTVDAGIVTAELAAAIRRGTEGADG